MELLLFALFFIAILIFFIAGKDDFGRKENKLILKDEEKNEPVEETKDEEKNEPVEKTKDEEKNEPVEETKDEEKNTN